MGSIRSGATEAHSNVSDNVPTAAVPASIAAGDDIVWAVAFVGSPTVTPPTGFTECAESPNEGTLGSRMRVYRKTATGSESGSFTGSLSSFVAWQTICFVVTGVSNTLQDMDGNGTYQYASNVSMTGGNVTTGGTDRFIVSIFSNRAAAGGSGTLTSVTPPTSFTTSASFDAGALHAIAVMYYTDPTDHTTAFSGSMLFSATGSKGKLVATLVYVDSGGGGGETLMGQACL